MHKIRTIYRAYPAILGLILLCGAMVSSLPAKAKSAAQKYPVSCLGRVVPGERIIRLDAPPGSIVKELRVNRGDVVEKGMLLAVLQNYDVRSAALQQAKLEVKVAEKRLELVRAGEKVESLQSQQSIVNRQQALLDNAKKELERQKNLLNKNVVSQSAYDKALTNFNSLKQAHAAEVKRLQALKHVRTEDVELHTNAYEGAVAFARRAEAELELECIRAPINGTILDVYTFPGEALSSEGILAMGDESNMQIEAEVYLGDIPRVKLGTEAEITGDGFTETLHGKVVEIYNYAGTGDIYPVSSTEAVDRRIVKVRIRPEHPDQLKGLSDSEVEVLIQP